MSAISASSLQRRKSAHGRLQSSSLVPQTNSHRGTGITEECKAKVKSRRVKSARETRMEQEASDIFPPVLDTKNDKWGTTQYGDDFAKKQPFTPVPVRPVSPTRRNNPHPSKPFLQWKHPVRIHTHKKAISPPEEAWKYISEGFYDDYTDTHNTGDAKNEVPVTNLAKIEFPGKNKNETQHLISGTKVQLNPRSCWVHRGHHIMSSSVVIRPPSPKSRMIHNTVRENSLPALREWLKTASNKERQLVLQMLTAAHTDSEDIRLKKAVDEVLRPDSACRVQKWLESATNSERKTLLNVLETLAVASEDIIQSPPQLILPPANWHQQTTPHHYRSNSYPISLRPHICHHRNGHTHIPSHNKGHYSRHDHKHHNHTSTYHHHKAHHCHKAHQNSTHKSVGNDCKNSGDMTLVGKKMGLKSQITPELWHHKIPPPMKELHVIHPASVFGQPHKDRGRHYAIHPEWPTA